MIPLKDELRSYTRPIITYLFLGINILVFFFMLSLGDGYNDFIRQFGAVPYEIFHPSHSQIAGPQAINFLPYLKIFSSMFIHAGFMHILGNMLFLWVFADNVEARLGHIKFLFFYLSCGVAGALLHTITTPNSTVPMVGASGAISGILGAYLLLFPRARVLALIPFGFFFRMVYLPAILFLGIWFLYQFLLGMSSIGVRDGGVAYFAHIGGFAAGFLLALPSKKKRKKNFEYRIF